MNLIFRNIIAFFALALGVAGTALAQTDLVESFRWTAATGTATGGNVKLDPETIIKDKTVVNAEGQSTIYKVVDLYNLEGDQSEIAITLNEPLKKGDVISITGFYYFNGETPADACAIAEIGTDRMRFDGFNNIYKNALLPEAVSRVVEKSSVGATEITLKAEGKTLWTTEIVVNHDPNAKAFLSVDPAAGSTIDIFREYDSTIKLTTNFEADRIRMSMKANDDPSFALNAMLAPAGVSEGVYAYVYEFESDIKLYEGIDYEAVFTAYKDDEVVDEPYAVVYHGGSPIPYSDVTLTFQIPAVDAVITSVSENEVALCFSAAANVESVTVAYGETVEQAEFKAADDTKTKWLVTVSEQVINDYLAFSLKVEAKDAQGRIIGGDESKDYVTATFKCNVPKLLSVSPASDDEYDELTSFVLSYESGIELIDEQAAITLTKDDKEYAGALTKVGGSYVFALDTPVTLAGTYSLSIPASMFSLGIGFDNEAMTVEYTVRKKEYDAEVKFYNIDGKTSPLNNLGSFVIDFKKGGYKAGYVNDRTLYSSPIVLVNADDEEVAKTSSYDIVENTANFRFDFSKDIYGAGLYYLVVPKNVFWLSRDINNLSYIPNEDMIFEVTIEKSEDPEVDFGPITITPENGSRVNTLSRTVIRFEKAFSVSVAPEAETEYDIYAVEDGAPADAVASKAVLKKYITPDGMDLDGRINMSLCFEPAITKAGTYTTTIPANSLYITYTTGLKLYFDRDWTFTYTVDPNAGIEDIYLPVDPSELDENSLVRVYNLQGILVREGMLKEALDGLHGLYIVNGFKLFIK